MNKMLIVVFDTEIAAEAGLHALRLLDAEGDITLYASGVIAKDMAGKSSIRQSTGQGPVGTGVGLAVGSLIGLLAGPGGLVVGALAGTLTGALRDFWMAGVSMDFIDEARRFLKPGKVALIAEVEEEWVIPVDSALEAAGGMVFRRTRIDLLEAQVDHDIATFRAELGELEAEVTHATGAAKQKLDDKAAAARSRLDQAMEQARERVDSLQSEADRKTAALKAQLARTQGKAKAKIEDRVNRLKTTYHARSAKLSQAWGLTREALAF